MSISVIIDQYTLIARDTTYNGAPVAVIPLNKVTMLKYRWDPEGKRPELVVHFDRGDFHKIPLESDEAVVAALRQYVKALTPSYAFLSESAERAT